jgi:hypothetical protein
VKIVADESVDRQIVDQLRRDGHEVLYIAELDSGSTTKRSSAEAATRMRSC